MEIRDGFIISVFNYCDRWCETCALTSYCRLCNDVARDEAPLLQDLPPAPPRWLEDVLEEMSSFAGGPLTEQELAASEPKMDAAHEEIYERAKAYCVWAHDCVGQREHHHRNRASDPIAVISWFAHLNASKIRCALTGLAEFDGNREVAADHEGAAKVALLGIDRSYAAWQQLVAEHRISVAQARTCIEELAWIRARLETAIPGARAFVRPGFDEPDAVAGLQSVGGLRRDRRD